MDEEESELQRLQDLGKLKWSPKTRKWNRKFYPVYDKESGKFLKYKFGDWVKTYCAFCGRKIETVKDNPRKRASKYCKIQHQKLHANIISRAKKKFNLPSSDFDNKELDKLLLDLQELKKLKNPEYKHLLELQQRFDEIQNRKSNWMISIPSIYEYTRDKTGQLHEQKIKESVESKTIVVTIDGVSFPYTTKTRNRK